MQCLLMISLRRGKLGKPRAKSQPLETNGNYVTQKESLISGLHSQLANDPCDTSAVLEPSLLDVKRVVYESRAVREVDYV